MSETRTRSLQAYRETLDAIGDGTVSTAFVREILDAAAAEIAAAQGEYTVTRAMEVARRSRSWVKRRLPSWRTAGLARQLDDGTWLIKDAALPRSTTLPRGGFDPSSPVGSIAMRLLKRTG